MDIETEMAALKSVLPLLVIFYNASFNVWESFVMSAAILVLPIKRTTEALST